MYTLPEAIGHFLHHCQFEKNLSPKTLKAYSIDLFQLNTFLITHDYSNEIVSISKNELRLFLVHIASYKPKSVKRKVAAIKTMFNYLEYEDIIQVNPLRKMRIKIKEPKILPTVMELKEVARIYAAVYERKNRVQDNTSYFFFEALRDIVVIELLFTTGARVSEIANLKVSNISLDTGNITIKGKGSKERIIQACNKETISVLRSYYRFFRNKIDATGYFLINRFNNKISDQSIRNIVSKYTTVAGLSKKITPHIFRHSFATLLLEKDVDIKYIQFLLGHSSIMTTQIYTHVNAEKQRQILKAKHPRRELVMQDN